MRLSRWVILIAVVVGLGCLKVSQRNAIFLKGYAVGERMGRVHLEETDVSWLNVEVTGLSSPTHLSQLAQERRLKLVAWSTFPPPRLLAEAMPREMFQLEAGSDKTRDTRPLAAMAPLGPGQPRADDEAAD